MPRSPVRQPSSERGWRAELTRIDAPAAPIRVSSRLGPADDVGVVEARQTIAPCTLARVTDVHHHYGVTALIEELRVDRRGIESAHRTRRKTQRAHRQDEVAGLQPGVVCG